MVGKWFFKDRKIFKKWWDFLLKIDFYDKLFFFKFWGVNIEIYWWSVLYWNWIIIVNNFSDMFLNIVYFRFLKGINCLLLFYNYNDYYMIVILVCFDMFMVNICCIRINFLK